MPASQSSADACTVAQCVFCCAVTLLALGNGAPDLSASIAAVRSGSYHLAVGSLLGMIAAFATTSDSTLSHRRVARYNSGQFRLQVPCSTTTSATSCSAYMQQAC